MRRAGSCLVGAAAAALVFSGSARAAELPPHGPLSVLVVSDTVNPHGLDAAALTEAGDLSVALNQPDSGLNLAAPGAVEVSSQCVDDAITALEGADPPDVIVYFAHRGAQGCDASDREAELRDGLALVLETGGGVVVLHHGSYTDPEKQAMLQMLGVQAGSIAWDEDVGQRVFNVAPGHFVTSNGVSYEGLAELAGAGDVPGGEFEYFDNVPDERYPNTALLTAPGETRTVLFASDSGGTRVLGYTLERPEWQGRVVFYQPGEYQPNALDDRDGPNFQVLANAIVYAAGEEGEGSGGDGSGGEGGAPPSEGGTAPATGGSAEGGSAPAQGGSAEAGASAEGGISSAEGGSVASGGTLDGRGGTSSTASGGIPARGGAASGGRTTGGTASAGEGDAPGQDGGCGCRVAGRGAALPGALFLLGLLVVTWRRRR